MSKTPKKTASRFTKKPLPKSRWLCDNPVDTPFLLAHALRFLEKLLLRYRTRFEDSEIFKPVASLMHHDKLMEIFNSITTVKIRDELRRSAYHSILEPQREKDEVVLDALWRHLKTRGPLRRKLRPWIAYARQSLEKKLRESNDSMLPRFSELQRLFSLNDIEMDILIAAAGIADNVWPALDLNQMHRSRRGAVIWAALLGVPKKRRNSCGPADRGLVVTGFMTR